MSKTIILSAIILLFPLLITNHVFALSDQERYNIGWQRGVSQSQYDWNNNIPYEPDCPKHHSDSFCFAYQEGYNHWWESAQQNIKTNAEQGTQQSAGINIKGNDNRVIIDQGSNDQGSSDKQGHDGSINPSCTILCANVQIK